MEEEKQKQEQPPEEISQPRVRVIIRKNIDLTSWSYQKIITDYIPLTWQKIFMRTTEERKTIAEVLIKKVFTQHQEVYPAKENLYRAFDLCSLHNVTVVIVGQDPYSKPAGKAVGLSFSIPPHDTQIPPSLKNIYKELKDEYPDFVIPKHGDLRNWTRQGVLLLNAALTVPEGKPEAHVGLWKPFFVKTVKALVEKRKDIIWVLWGNKAQTILQYLGNSPVLTSSHPSPLAMRGFDQENPFLGNGHFKKVNEILESQGKKPIDWQV